MRFVGIALAIGPLWLAAQQPVAGPQANAQPTRPEDKCSIEGQVVNAQTGDPLKKAHVRLYRDDNQGNSTYSTGTDASGHFVFQEVDPGIYTVLAGRNGFTEVWYRTRGTSRGAMPLRLGPGQRVRDVNLRLVPFGVIAGRVLDEDGEPVEHVLVMLTRDARGRRKPGQAGGSHTNDLGEYRIFGLEAGKYYLSATYQHNMAAQERTPSNAADEGYAPTFYPGTNDPTAAVAIDVAPGAQLRGIEVTLLKTRTVRIRGKVINGVGERLPQPVYVSLLPREKAAMGMGFYPRAMTQVRNADSTFELRGVTPGAYILMAQCWDENKPYVARQSVDVGDKNVDNISLLLAAGMDVKGTVRAEGPGGVAFGDLLVSLAPQEMLRMRGLSGKVGNDGSFSLANVPPVIYTIDVYGMPETFYIKSIRIGDADGLDAGLDFTRGGAGMLEILLSPNGGQVDGSVGELQQAAASSAVVVLATGGRRREQASLFKMTGTDAQGHFTIKGIAPGDYKLFAWEQSEETDYRDPEFLKPYESQGEAVTIREGSHESVQLKLIEMDNKAGKAAN